MSTPRTPSQSCKSTGTRDARASRTGCWQRMPPPIPIFPSCSPMTMSTLGYRGRGARALAPSTRAAASCTTRARMPASFQPPPGLHRGPTQIASRIRGKGDQIGPRGGGELGKWLAGDQDFRAIVETYVDTYSAWPCRGPRRRVLGRRGNRHDPRRRSPDTGAHTRRGHPCLRCTPCGLRQALAQEVLLESDAAGRPCPAASVFDPDCVPTCSPLRCALQAASSGSTNLRSRTEPTIGPSCGTVTGSGACPADRRRRHSGIAFGISVGGISVGISAAQVARALDESLACLRQSRSLAWSTRAPAGRRMPATKARRMVLQ